MKVERGINAKETAVIPKGIPGLISDHSIVMNKYLANETVNLEEDTKNKVFALETETKCEKKSKYLRHTPRWISHDRLVLRFFAYFDEKIEFKPTSQIRRRFVEIFFYTKDDTIEIIEPKQKNSGIMQGIFLKKMPISIVKLSVHNLLVGSSFASVGQKFNIFDCDLNTRKYFKYELSIDQPTPIEKLDRMDESFRVRPPNRVGLTLSQENILANKRFNGNFYGDFQKYLKYGKTTLKFLASWIDNHAIDEKRYFTILYFLCDDTIEIKERHVPNSGRDENSRFLNRTKPEGGDKKLTWKDFKTGAWVNLYERRFFIISCDEPTKQFYATQNIIQQVQDEIKDFKTVMTPSVPNSGRSLAKGTSREKQAYRKLNEFGDQALKLRLVMYNCTNEDSTREFVLAYYLADEQLVIYEPPKKNSGFVGGKFLEKNRYLNDETGKPFTDKDLKQIIVREVPIIKIQKREFRVTYVDRFSQSYLGVKFENKVRTKESEMQRIAHQLRAFVETTRIDFRKTFYKKDTRQHKFLNVKVVDSCINSLNSAGLVLQNSQLELIKKKYCCHGRFYYIDFCSDLTDLINHSVDSSITLKSANIAQIENMLNKKLQNEGQSLRILFRKFDADKSGTLTFSEFQELLKHFNIFLSLQQVSEIMARYDIDKEGTIEYQEFCNRVEKSQNKANLSHAPHDIDSLQLSDFTMLRDNNEELKADYLNTVQTQENKFNVEAYNSKILTRFVFLCSSKRTELRQVFRQIDDSKDGKLSKIEFETAIQMFREFSPDDQLIIINYFYKDKQDHLKYEEFMETVETLNK